MSHTDPSAPTNANNMQHLDIRYRNNHLILILEGEIDAYMVSKFRKYVRKTLDALEEKQSVVLDLSDVSFLDSHAIGLFVHILKRVHNVNGTLSFVGTTGQPASVLNMVGFNDSLVFYYNTLDDAITVPRA